MLPVVQWPSFVNRVYERVLEARASGRVAAWRDGNGLGTTDYGLGTAEYRRGGEPQVRRTQKERNGGPERERRSGTAAVKRERGQTGSVRSRSARTAGLQEQAPAPDQ